MKLDYTKFKVLANQHGLSDRAMALKIGMSPPGYVKMIKKKSCSVETLVCIAEKFNKPLSYFFIEYDPNNVLEEKSSEYDLDTSPADLNTPDQCTNPKCMQIMNELLLENRSLLFENRDLRIDISKKTEEIIDLIKEKGAGVSGKKVKGGVEKSRATG